MQVFLSPASFTSHSRRIKMKILILGYEHPRDDKRTLRSFEALREIGEVFYQYISDAEERSSDDHLIPLQKPPKSYDPISWFLKWMIFDKKIERLIESLKPSLIYFHYLPITGTKLFKIAKKCGAKVIFDIHEIIPDQFMKTYRLFDIIRPLFWRTFKEALIISDGLIVVSKESVEYIFKKVGIRKDYFLLPNYAHLKIEPLYLKDRQKSLVIVGKVGRSLKDECRFLRFMKKKGFVIRMIGWENYSIDCVDIEKLPFLPYEKMMKEISKSMFSFVSFKSHPRKEDYSNDIYSLPNKLFDSVAAGTPVIGNSRFISVKNWIERDKVGLVISMKDDEKTWEKMIQDYISHYDANIMLLKENQDKYIWDEGKKKKYLEYINRVVG